MRRLFIVLAGSSALALAGCASLAEGLVDVAAAMEAQNAQSGSMNLPASYWETNGTAGPSTSPVRYCGGQTPGSTPPTPGSVCPQ